MNNQCNCVNNIYNLLNSAELPIITDISTHIRNYYIGIIQSSNKCNCVNNVLTLINHNIVHVNVSCHLLSKLGTKYSTLVNYVNHAASRKKLVHVVIFTDNDAYWISPENREYSPACTSANMRPHSIITTNIKEIVEIITQMHIDGSKFYSSELNYGMGIQV